MNDQSYFVYNKNITQMYFEFVLTIYLVFQLLFVFVFKKYN